MATTRSGASGYGLERIPLRKAGKQEERIWVRVFLVSCFPQRHLAGGVEWNVTAAFRLVVSSSGEDGDTPGGQTVAIGKLTVAITNKGRRSGRVSGPAHSRPSGHRPEAFESNGLQSRGRLKLCSIRLR